MHHNHRLLKSNMTRGSIYLRFFLTGLRTKQRSRIYGITIEKNPNKEKRTFLAKHSSAQNFCTKTPPIDAAGGGECFPPSPRPSNTKNKNTTSKKLLRLVVSTLSTNSHSQLITHIRTTHITHP